MNSAPATPPLLTPEWQPGQLEDNTLGQGPDIWLLPLDQITPEPGLLSPAERARADGLATAEARRAMLALRTAQRRILASYLDTPAAGLVFVAAAKGKPALADHSLRFNLSHSQGLAACRTWSVESEHRPQRAQFLPDLQPNSPAIGQKYGEKWAAAVDVQPTTSKSDRLLATLAVSRAEVGIDLEWPRPVRHLTAIARRLFDTETLRTLESLQGPQLLAAFTRAWVCLEARQKLSGEGLFGERHLIAHQLWLYQLEDGGYLALAQAGTQSPEPRLWRFQNP